MLRLIDTKTDDYGVRLYRFSTVWIVERTGDTSWDWYNAQRRYTEHSAVSYSTAGLCKRALERYLGYI